MAIKIHDFKEYVRGSEKVFLLYKGENVWSLRFPKRVIDELPFDKWTSEEFSTEDIVAQCADIYFQDESESGRAIQALKRFNEIATEEGVTDAANKSMKALEDIYDSLDSKQL